MDDDHNAVYLGAFENGESAWFSNVDRRRHLYCVGRSGSGKSTLLRNLMIADLAAHRPFALLDPHGDLAIQVAANVPPHRTNEVLFVDLSDRTHHVGLNPLYNVAPGDRPRAAAHIASSFAHVWGLTVEINARLLNVLNSGLRILLDTPNSTLLGMQRLLVDVTYRDHLVRHCTDPVIRHFWTHEVAAHADRYLAEAFAPLQSRLNLLLSDPAIRHVVGQVKTTINIKRMIDEGQVLILRIPLGKLGETPTYLLGALFATAFAQAAEARTDQPEHERRDYSLILDEFQLFSTTSIAGVLSGSRKYRLHLLLAHQYLGQLPEQLRQAIPANAGSLIVFSVSPEDAELLGPEFNHDDTLFDQSALREIDLGKFNPAKLANMEKHTAWVRLMKDGERGGRRLLYPEFLDQVSAKRLEAVRNHTRATYTRPRQQIQRKIEQFLKNTNTAC